MRYEDRITLKKLIKEFKSQKRQATHKYNNGIKINTTLGQYLQWHSNGTKEGKRQFFEAVRDDKKKLLTSTRSLLNVANFFMDRKNKPIVLTQTEKSITVYWHAFILQGKTYFIQSVDSLQTFEN